MTDSGIRLLLVEDDKLIALMKRRALENFGYAVAVAETGEAAIAAAAADPGIELVLMDVSLGEGISGLDAAERILALRRLPLIFLTGHAEADFAGRSGAVAGCAFVSKNATAAVLDLAIKSALTRGRRPESAP
jgi:CheY-like chemotaxis protein